MIRDFFADLELGPDASVTQIRRAYKKLARRFHPDLNPEDKYAEESFQRIQEAFEFLSSPTRLAKLRKIIEEQQGRETKPKSKSTSLEKTSQSSSWDKSKWGEITHVPASSQEFIKNWKEEPSSVSKRRPKFTRPSEDLDIYLDVQMEGWKRDFLPPFTTELEYRYQKPCSSCRGAGGHAKSVKATCKRCAGLGFYSIERGAMHWKKTCDLCIGKGFVVSGPCSSCSGKGKIFQREKLEITIPQGIDLAKPIVLKDFGHFSFDGKKRGDLWLRIDEATLKRK